MNIKEIIKESVSKALEDPSVSVELEHPTDPNHGDFSTNIALTSKMDAKELINKIQKPKEVEKIEIAGPGFINFYLSQSFITDYANKVVKGENLEKQNKEAGKKVLIEYTDPNPFKQFHIGHLMSNAIGESIARLIEFSGAEVKRANYFGDVGPQIAKALWGMQNSKAQMPKEIDSLERKVEFLGNSYTHGAEVYESDPEIKNQIDEINLHIYKKDDPDINALYQKGKKWSMDHFEEIYKKLGTTFDYYFPESEVSEEGTRVVRKNLGKVFHESKGAIVFKGEDHGLHTRVFITSKGLPTYEAKEIGLQYKKQETYPFDVSITVTASEQVEFMKVSWKAFEEIGSKEANKLKHVAHGMMRLTSGKMSSRKGNVITGDQLISELENMALEKVSELPYSEDEKKDIAEKVAVAAIKYSVLKQSPQKDIVFDMGKSLSFEGDSGPYLQYTVARINSILEKANEKGLKPGQVRYLESTKEILHMVPRFLEVVERSTKEYAPQYLTTYLINLASAFNSFYANEKIIDIESKESSSERLALVQAVATILSKGLNLLGIAYPKRM